MILLYFFFYRNASISKESNQINKIPLWRKPLIGHILPMREYTPPHGIRLNSEEACKKWTTEKT